MVTSWRFGNGNVLFIMSVSRNGEPVPPIANFSCSFSQIILYFLPAIREKEMMPWVINEDNISKLSSNTSQTSSQISPPS